MAQKLLFKILMLTLVLGFTQNTHAQSQCWRIFDQIQSRVVENSEGKVDSRIQNIKWIKKRLFEDGELAKLKTQDKKTVHNEFLSELLYETVKLMFQNFNRSGLDKIEGAGRLFGVIVEDIKVHRTNKKVTYDYFLRINSAIVRLWSSANQKTTNGRQTRNDLKNGDPVEVLIDYKKQTGYLSSKDFVELPLLVPLKMQDFLELGVEVAPLGVSFKTEGFIHGVVSDTAYLYNHDKLHIGIFFRRWERLKAAEKHYYKKISDFFKIPPKDLTYEEEVLSRVALFTYTHELYYLPQFVKLFNSKDYNWKESEEYKGVLERAYNDVTNKEQDSEIRINNMTREEYDAITTRGLEIRIKEYQSRN